ncbi:MAG TPA: hypothetical protein VIV60_14300 [Polyangiaceae bacterium]
MESKLDQLNTRKHALDAELILYLSELERRRLYREHACASLFEFCVTRLGCSEDTAYKRVEAARQLQQFPVVFDFLANRRIHLTGLVLLKPHLTATNQMSCPVPCSLFRQWQWQSQWQWQWQWQSQVSAQLD